MQFLRRIGIRRLCRRYFTRKARGGEDNPILTDFHNTPLSDDVIDYRSRLTRLSKELLESANIGIQTLSRRGFRLIDGSFLFGPIAVFPKSVLSWRVLTPDDITEESLEFFTMLEPKLDVLIIGVGDHKHVDSVRRRVAPFLSKNRIGFEVMNTEDAIPTYNFINAESRCAAAALYPPQEMQISESEHTKTMMLLRGIDEMDSNFLIDPVRTTGVYRYDLIRKIWGEDEMIAFQKIEQTPEFQEFQRTGGITLDVDRSKIQKKIEERAAKRIEEGKKKIEKNIKKMVDDK